MTLRDTPFHAHPHLIMEKVSADPSGTFQGQGEGAGSDTVSLLVLPAGSPRPASPGPCLSDPWIGLVVEPIAEAGLEQ